MRDLGYVCLRCRVGQLIACDSRRIRRPGRAASFSTTTTTAATVSDEPTHHGHSQARPVTVDQPQPFVKFRRRPETGPGAMNSRSPQHQPSDRSDMLISLFQSVVNSRPQTPRQLPADSPGIMELWQDAHQMRSLLDKRSSAETTWQFFEETMYPRIVNIGGGKAVPRIILRQLYRGFFTQIAEEKAKDFTCSSLPSLELITHRMAELGALWPWTTMMLQLVDTIRRINPSLDAYPSLEDNEAAMARRDTLVRELQLAWRAFNVKGAFKGPPPPKIPDNTQKAFANAFAELYPGYDKGQMYRPMWVALASYGLLTDPKLHFGVKDSAFVVMMQALVETNALPFEEEHRTFAQLCPPHLYAYVLVRLWVGVDWDETRRGSRARRKSDSTPSTPSVGSIREAMKPSLQGQSGQTRTTWTSQESHEARLSHFARSSQSEWARLEKGSGMAQQRQEPFQKSRYGFRTLDISRVPVQASQSGSQIKSSTSGHVGQHPPTGSLVEPAGPVQNPQPEETRASQEIKSQPSQISQVRPESEPDVVETKQTLPASRQPEGETREPSQVEQTTPTSQQPGFEKSRTGQEVQTVQPAQDEVGQLSEEQPAQPPSPTEAKSDPEPVQALKLDLELDLESTLEPDLEKESAQAGEANQPSPTAAAESTPSVQEVEEINKPQLLPKREPSPPATSQPAKLAAPVMKTAQASQTPKSTPKLTQTEQASQARKTAPASRQTKTSNEPESRPVTRRLDVSEFTHEHFISRIHRQIGQAIHKRSIMLMDRAWDEFWGDEAEPSAAQIKKLSEMVELFDYFIIGYTKVRKPNRAIFVWNSMLQAGLKPTIKTWTAMIQGCTKALNPDGIKLVWSRLVASGTKLDTTIWTARISGLIISGDLQAGIDALNEMAAIWKNRDAPQNAALAVQPSIEPVNAALAWLLRLDRTSTAETLLQWAARQGIQPDIFTFNTLLRPLVRTGNTAEMNQLFDAMAQAGVRADVVTYTILLDGALADVGTMTPDEQTAAVTRVIGDMERAGVEANMMAYAKIIYNILQNGNTNAAAAVRAVISHIWGRGLELTSHIYTMLAEHYFSRDPPDAAAVTHLIASRRLAANPNIDRVFWERVIKGYCQAGDVGRAVRIFEHASGMGSTITFSTLYEFLSALAENEMMDEARKVVGRAKEMNAAEEPDEQQHGVSGGPGQSRRFWKHRFWHLADAYGLLEEGQLQKFLEGTNWRAGRG